MTRMMEPGRPAADECLPYYFQYIDLVPDGHIVELATLGPGFAVDEDVSALGQRLQLPPWLEPQRAAITRHLRPLTVPAWRALEPALP